jgi:hypothetical protein
VAVIFSCDFLTCPLQENAMRSASKFSAALATALLGIAAGSATARASYRVTFREVGPVAGFEK